MAKCITNGKIVRRVPNEDAKKLVDNGTWKYCSKDDYRRFEEENGKK